MQPFLQKILRKMCKAADVEFEDVDFDSDNWYESHTWTSEQQDDFASWLSKFVAKKENRVLVAGGSTLLANKENRQRFVNKFIAQYGWLIKK